MSAFTTEQRLVEQYENMYERLKKDERRKIIASRAREQRKKLNEKHGRYDDNATQSVSE